MSIGQTSGLLWIEAPIWYAIMRAVKTKPTFEVMGVGHATIDKDGIICMDDLLIPPQEVTGATVHTQPKAFMKLWDQLVRDYAEKWTEWCVMWHSHCSMTTGPSGTDTSELAQVVANNWPFAVGLVVNVRGESTAWAEIRKPFTSSVELEVMVDSPVYPEWDGRIDGWMKQVTVVKPPPVVSVGSKMPAKSSARLLPYSDYRQTLLLDHRYGLGDDDLDDDDDDDQVLRNNGALPHLTQLEKDDGSQLAASVGLIIPDSMNLPNKAIDRLAKLILAAESKGQCPATHEDVRCVMHIRHKVPIHAGVYETNDGSKVPAYFLARGKVPSIEQIRSQGLPI